MVGLTRAHWQALTGSVIMNGARGMLVSVSTSYSNLEVCYDRDDGQTAQGLSYAPFAKWGMLLSVQSSAPQVA